MSGITVACEALCRYLSGLDAYYGPDNWPRLPPEPGWPSGREPWPSLPPGLRTAADDEVMALLQADCEPRPGGPPPEIVADVRGRRLVRAVMTAGFAR